VIFNRVLSDLSRREILACGEQVASVNSLLRAFMKHTMSAPPSEHHDAPLAQIERLSWAC
jgi:hypothetical protein